MTQPQGSEAPREVLPVERMCRLAGVSRAGYYRHWRASAPRREEAALRHEIQRLTLANRHYGYRRITELLRREDWAVNRKRVLRLMREDNLLCLRRKAFAPATTQSRHGWRVWPNLAWRLEPTAPNQLWVADITYVRLAEAGLRAHAPARRVADITYVRLAEGFAFLAVILDAFSRRAVGWAMADHLRAELALAALDRALASRDVVPGGLVHHSDRGIQYACRDYIARLAAYAIQPSMSRVGCPYDNAMAESFIKTLKAEEVDGRAYRDLAEAKAAMGRFIDEVYNRQRLHSALAYKAPAEFEASLPTRPAASPGLWVHSEACT